MTSDLVPVVDHGLCEGKGACVRVCPYDVFVVARIDDADFAELGTVARLRKRVHRRLTAYTANLDACESCGLCAAACPEDAIELVPSGAASP